MTAKASINLALLWNGETVAAMVGMKRPLITLVQRNEKRAQAAQADGTRSLSAIAQIFILAHIRKKKDSSHPNATHSVSLPNAPDATRRKCFSLFNLKKSFFFSNHTFLGLLSSTEKHLSWSIIHLFILVWYLFQTALDEVLKSIDGQKVMHGVLIHWWWKGRELLSLSVILTFLIICIILHQATNYNPPTR